MNSSYCKNSNGIIIAIRTKRKRLMKITKQIFLVLLFFISVSNASDSLWSVVSYMPIPVSGATAVTFDDKIYLFGGFSDSLFAPLDIVQVFDPNTLEWSFESNMLAERAFLFAASNENGIFYGGGRFDSTTNFIYDYGSLEFIAPSNPSINTPLIIDNNSIFNRIISTAEMVNNDLFLIGGDSMFDNNLIVKYNVESKTIVDSLISFKTEEYVNFELMPILFNNNIYLIGGIAIGISANISVVDVNFENQIYRYASLLEPRAKGVAVGIKDANQIYVIGGINELHNALSSVEILTIYDDSVASTIGYALNFGRTNFTATEYNNRIYVFGGLDENYFTIGSVEMIEIKPNSVTLISTNIPQNFTLKQNYPNPFNPSTKIEYSIPLIVGHSTPSLRKVSLKVYDILGREITTLVNKEQIAGTYSVDFILSNFNLSSGVYYYSLSWGGYSLTNKMILIK